MKRQVSALIGLCAIAATLVLTSSPAHAGFNDPWYGFYRTKGGLVMTVGPFSDKYSCGAAKYNIPFDATWLGCRQ